MPDMPAHQQRFAIRLDRRDALRMSCQSAGCANERGGWVIVLDPTEAKHRDAAAFIEMDSGCKYARFFAKDAAAQIEQRGSEWGVSLPHLRDVLSRALPHMAVYVFPPGQPCFKPHLDREVIFTHATRNRLLTHDPVDFNEHWNESAAEINELIQRG